ncbi:VOC family protein [Planococcus shixiaomingii]|uniref:VOC family protein n=1 Tax=Planococcus shixiaomingii TaxID=3058393 RepID=UPI0026215F2B|nr:VOC family protein [Planococcus sp. N022]WKA55236.1 VOC family protein [Planococcus sp. N022]
MYLDHIVHFVEEEPQAAVDFWNEQGFSAVPGGQHLKWGTHNALLYAKDCYIEWLSVEKPEIAAKANHPLTALLLHDGIGFGTICLRTKAIEELDVRLKEEGFETSGVLEAERRTNAGKLIQWKMLFIKEAVSNELPSPFFIQWQEDDVARLDSLRKSKALLPENEMLELEKCVFGVHDIAAITEKWRKMLGGKLELENCRIEFQLTGGKKERLESVAFKGADQTVAYSQGVYHMPRKGNNTSN